jgi:hypothetical protein
LPQSLRELVITGVAECVRFALRSMTSGALQSKENFLPEMIIHASPQGNRFDGIVRVALLYHSVETVRGELLAVSLASQMSHSRGGLFGNVHPKEALRMAKSALVH